jgi:hypothetical protein
MKKLIFLAIIGWLSVAMQSSESKTEKIIANNKFSINLPDYLEETKDLNKDATLQYLNPVREVYVMVIEDDKKELHDVLIENELQEIFPANVEGFARLTGSAEEDAFLIIDDWENMRDTTINNLPAIVFENSRKIDGVSIYYYLAFVEGKDTYYQILTWTLAYREKLYKNTFQEIIYSFKEL